MRKKIPVIVIVLLFLIGILALLYPLASEWLSSQSQTTAIENYNRAAEGLDQEEYEALREAAWAYNKGLMGSVVLTDPFDESIEARDSEAYNALLNLNGDGVMGSVRIPKIGVKLPVYHGTSHEVLEMGAGHLENTSLPIGGTGTHAIISAHSGLPTASLFTDLTKLTEGDLFFIDVLNETLSYRVDQVKTVEPEDVSDLLINNEEDYVTLVTCTPYGINSHRLLVRGVRTDYEETLETEVAVTEQTAVNPWSRPYIIAGILFLLIMALYMILLLLWRQRKKNGRVS